MSNPERTELTPAEAEIAIREADELPIRSLNSKMPPQLTYCSLSTAEPSELMLMKLIATAPSNPIWDATAKADVVFSVKAIISIRREEWSKKEEVYRVVNRVRILDETNTVWDTTSEPCIRDLATILSVTGDPTCSHPIEIAFGRRPADKEPKRLAAWIPTASAEATELSPSDQGDTASSRKTSHQRGRKNSG